MIDHASDSASGHQGHDKLVGETFVEYSFKEGFVFFRLIVDVLANLILAVTECRS